MAMIPWDNDIQTLAKAIYRVMTVQTLFASPTCGRCQEACLSHEKSVDARLDVGLLCWTLCHQALC